MRRAVGWWAGSGGLRAVAVVGCSFSPTVKRRPRQRRFGGSGLIFGLAVEEVGFGGLGEGSWMATAVSVSVSLRLGVIIPGFSCCEATSRKLREDVEAGSRCIPSRSAWFGLCVAGDIKDSSSRVGERLSGKVSSAGEIVLDG